MAKHHTDEDDDRREPAGQAPTERLGRRADEGQLGVGELDRRCRGPATDRQLVGGGFQQILLLYAASEVEGEIQIRECGRPGQRDVVIGGKEVLCIDPEWWHAAGRGIPEADPAPLIDEPLDREPRRGVRFMQPVALSRPLLFGRRARGSDGGEHHRDTGLFTAQGDVAEECRSQR